ncbi:hypothetical protein DFS34DRAFT_591429 [Phlyctochytrium arcticum]|nr:hypothetical protein DFS34DRAFT_591429 [Phlyctochytrium arcticum]
MEVDSGPLYTAEQIRIPPELPDILKSYTKHIIRTQPDNILEASAEYFGRLAKQRRDGGVVNKLNNMQLEAFYNKFYHADKVTVSKAEIQDACHATSIPNAYASDIFRVGGWSETTPWLKFWALLVASTAGTLFATVETVASILGDNGRVPLGPVIEIIQYLGEQDQSLDQPQVEEVVRNLMGSQTNDYEINSLLTMIRNQIRPRSGAVATNPFNQPSPPAGSSADNTTAQTDEEHQASSDMEVVAPQEGGPDAPS